jgi:hypothetical protein
LFEIIITFFNAFCAKTPGCVNLEIDSDCHPRPSTASFTTPSQAGRCNLVEVIAEGGMGVVYRDRDLELGRDPAVKDLRERHAVAWQVFKCLSSKKGDGKGT